MNCALWSTLKIVLIIVIVKCSRWVENEVKETGCLSLRFNSPGLRAQRRSGEAENKVLRQEV